MSALVLVFECGRKSNSSKMPNYPNSKRASIHFYTSGMGDASDDDNDDDGMIIPYKCFYITSQFFFPPFFPRIVQFISKLTVTQYIYIFYQVLLFIHGYVIFQIKTHSLINTPSFFHNNKKKKIKNIHNLFFFKNNQTYNFL